MLLAWEGFPNVALISHSLLFQAGALAKALLLLALLAEHRGPRSASTKRRRPSWRPPGSLHMSSDITSGCSEWKQTWFFNNCHLRHDFHQSHGGKGYHGSNTRGCEGEGLMSYGDKKNTHAPSKRPNAWSTCSNSDFENWYRDTGNQCLKSGAGGNERPGGSGGI